MQIRLKPTNEVITSDNALQWIIEHIDPANVEFFPNDAELEKSLKEAIETIDGPIEVCEIVPEPVKAVEEPADAKAERFEAILETAHAKEPMSKHGRRALGDRIEQKPRRLDYDL